MKPTNNQLFNYLQSKPPGARESIIHTMEQLGMLQASTAKIDREDLKTKIISLINDNPQFYLQKYGNETLKNIKIACETTSYFSNNGLVKLYNILQVDLIKDQSLSDEKLTADEKFFERFSALSDLPADDLKVVFPEAYMTSLNDRGLFEKTVQSISVCSPAEQVKFINLLAQEHLYDLFFKTTTTKQNIVMASNALALLHPLAQKHLISLVKSEKIQFDGIFDSRKATTYLSALSKEVHESFINKMKLAYVSDGFLHYSNDDKKRRNLLLNEIIKPLDGTGLLTFLTHIAKLFAFKGLKTHPKNIRSVHH